MPEKNKNVSSRIAKVMTLSWSSAVKSITIGVYVFYMLKREKFICYDMW